jgi:predicted nucleic acid-binding protein
VTSATTWLVDTSALARLSMPEVGEVMRPLIDAGRVAVTAVTLLAIGYPARS